MHCLLMLNTDPPVYVMWFQNFRLFSHPVLDLPGSGWCSGFGLGNCFGAVYEPRCNHSMENLSSFSRQVLVKAVHCIKSKQTHHLYFLPNFSKSLIIHLVRKLEP